MITKRLNKFKKVANRSLATVSHKILPKLGYTLKPTMIANFAITYKCNYRCVTCNIGVDSQNNPKAAEGELSIHEIDKFFSNNKKILSNVGSLQITGGEPFLRKDIVGIVSIINKYLPKCSLWIPTNGSCPDLVYNKMDEICNICNEIGISVSLHGDKTLHDQFTGIAGSFENAEQTIRKLLYLREKRSSLEISLSFTLTPDNYKEINKVYKLARKYNVGFSLRPGNFSGVYYKNLKKKLDYHNIIDKLALVLRDLIKDTFGLSTLIDPEKIASYYYLNGILGYIENPRNFRLPCSAGSLSFFLDPFGTIYPCLMMDAPLGNIRKQSFNEIWYSKMATQIRGDINKGNCPNCWVECETYRNIYENIHILLIPFLKIWYPSLRNGIFQTTKHRSR